jgi:hypothetical protein
MVNERPGRFQIIAENTIPPKQKFELVDEMTAARNAVRLAAANVLSRENAGKYAGRYMINPESIPERIQ